MMKNLLKKLDKIEKETEDKQLKEAIKKKKTVISNDKIIKK